MRPVKITCELFNPYIYRHFHIFSSEYMCIFGRKIKPRDMNYYSYINCYALYIQKASSLVIMKLVIINKGRLKKSYRYHDKLSAIDLLVTTLVYEKNDKLFRNMRFIREENLYFMNPNLLLTTLCKIVKLE